MFRNEDTKSRRPHWIAAARWIMLVALAVLHSERVAQAQWTTSGSNIYNSNTGNVGIGTTSPSAKLDVESGNAIVNSGGTITSGDLAARTLTLGLRPDSYESTLGFQSSSSSKGAIGYGTNGFGFSTWNGAWATPLTIAPGGNIGIGTSTPASALTVLGSGTPGGHGVLQTIYPFGKTDTTERYVTSWTSNDSGATTWKLMISAIGNATAGNRVFSLQTGTESVAYGGILALQPQTGKVGIGTTNPSTTLDVVGDVTVSGNISAKYQDLAEWVQTSRMMGPGTVVILDPDVTNSVIPSTKAYDTRVAGVVSANPGIILGEAAEGKVKVATTGRVKVRVDASEAPIQRGDLLVTSSREGMAIRSEAVSIGGIEFHRPGTLIGKALEPLNEGAGEILVLLSLQ